MDPQIFMYLKDFQPAAPKVTRGGFEKFWLVCVKEFYDFYFLIGLYSNKRTD